MIFVRNDREDELCLNLEERAFQNGKFVICVLMFIESRECWKHSRLLHLNKNRKTGVEISEKEREQNFKTNQQF